MAVDIVSIALILSLNFCHIYGLAENRLFREAGEYFPDHHFRFYHAWIAGLDIGVGIIVYALSRSFFLTSFAVVYFPLGLDVAWWLKRLLDFKFRLVILDIEVFLGRSEAETFYNEKNEWHERRDWDNYGGFPIIGCYLWWWVFAFISIVLFGGFFLISI